MRGVEDVVKHAVVRRVQRFRGVVGEVQSRSRRFVEQIVADDAILAGVLDSAEGGMISAGGSEGEGVALDQVVFWWSRR